MNAKPATTLLAVSILAAESLSGHGHTLAGRDHVHSELRTEPVATTATYFTASGGLGMDADMWECEGEVAFATGPVIGYRVKNLPPSEEAAIADFGGHDQAKWQILRTKNGVQGKWTGNYATAQEALGAVEDELARRFVPPLYYARQT